MATPYSSIYDRAMFRFLDKKFACLESEDQSILMRNFLMSAISDFQEKCKENLIDRDEELQQFNSDLSDEVQEILSLGISYYWISSQVLNSELLRNKLSTKDYSYFSPANLLREMTVLRKQIHNEYKHRIINYTYDHGDLTMDD